MPNPKPSRLQALTTDPHLWLPIIVLCIGIGILVMVK